MAAEKVQAPAAPISVEAKAAKVKRTATMTERVKWPLFYTAWLGGYYHLLLSIHHQTHKFGTPWGRTAIVAGSIFAIGFAKNMISPPVIEES